MTPVSAPWAPLPLPLPPVARFQASVAAARRRPAWPWSALILTLLLALAPLSERPLAPRPDPVSTLSFDWQSRASVPFPPALAALPAPRATAGASFVLAYPGAQWPCSAGRAINVVVDPAGAAQHEIDRYLAAIGEASRQTGRPVIVVGATFSATAPELPDTIYVAWHSIAGIPPTTSLHPGYTKLNLVGRPVGTGQTGLELESAATVFSAGIPEAGYFHEVGREFQPWGVPVPD